jgi:hypothetical protein
MHCVAPAYLYSWLDLFCFKSMVLEMGLRCDYAKARNKLEEMSLDALDFSAKYVEERTCTFFR